MSGRARRFLLTATLAACAHPPAALAQAGGAAPRPLLVIAHPAAVVDSAALDVAELRRIFMLRRRFWGDGTRIAPVNLPAADSIRLRFSQRILGQSPKALSGYWNDLYFHGVDPPTVVESEQAVQLFVARTQGAVGYIREEALDPTLGTVRVLGLIR